VLYVKWGNDDERDFPDGVPTELTVLNSTSRADFEGWTVIQCDNAVVVHPSGAGGAGDALFWYGRPAWLIKREALNRDIEAGIEPGPGYVSQDGPTPDGLGGPTCFLGADGVWYRA
jgi:hypothetical protein